MGHLPGVIATELSSNMKTGPVSATSVSQGSCPNSCPLKGGACYGEQGPGGIHARRITREATRADVLARNEAKAIRGLKGILDLRVHAIVGDCRTDYAARTVSGAMVDYEKKRGRTAWTYTHAWRDVKRESWGDANVLASCDSLEDVKKAQGQGWAAAVIVPEFKSRKLYEQDGVKILPCPNQANEKKPQCIDCRLCMKPDLLRREGYAIGFEPHGSKKNQLKRELAAR